MNAFLLYKVFANKKYCIVVDNKLGSVGINGNNPLLNDDFMKQMEVQALTFNEKQVINDLNLSDAEKIMKELLSTGFTSMLCEQKA